MIEQRITYEDAFYYEPLSDNLRRYITGVSFPDADDLRISYDDLRYVHILHYDFDGNPAEGELICNATIAQDLVEIFYELYLNEYHLEKVRLIDEYDGDDTASMEDNNTSCFNYRVVEGTTSLSKHALGLALDINPLYNPYITYEEDGSEKVSPVAALTYADRDTSFPYKIDENDLCYKLFTERGFIWGGNWNSCKDYQHFQKSIQE
ncbi:MAG: M15 family metallopeptidase [Lachnospiraceae bacterium]|nr:M15 family metallopeptidase [Lachnospiraceae bacterium]